MLTLTVEKRDAIGKSAKRLKKEGRIPAVFYGKKEQSTPIAVSLREFEKVWGQAGESTVIALEGFGGRKEALIHAVMVDAVMDTPQHADFYIIEKGQKVHVSVPLEFIGTAPAVKELGGILVKVMHELEVEAEPTNLPHHIDVDISPLFDFEQQITIGDITLPEGVVAIAPASEVVGLVSAAQEELEEEAPAMDLSDIEVAQKGKQEDEEGGSTETESA